MSKKKSHEAHVHNGEHAHKNAVVHKSETAKPKVVRTNKVVISEHKPKYKILGDAPQENCFILCNGRPVKNVQELADALGELGDYAFNHHVTPDKNDFATWVRNIFQDEELASQLANSNELHNTRIIMYKHLVNKLKDN